MSRVAILQANSFGEYDFAETSGFYGNLQDYLSECEGDVEICPEDEVPVTHNCNGATILRVEWRNGGINQDELWYGYEAFWEE